MLSSTVVACIAAAASSYNVPQDVVAAILHVEGGRIAQETKNKNGTHDIGPMQINSIWIPTLAKKIKTDFKTAKSLLKNNVCVNITFGTWILKTKINETGSLYGGIAAYNSKSNLGIKYADKVIDYIRGNK